MAAENQLYTVYQGGTLLAQSVYYGDGNRRYKYAGGTWSNYYYDGDQEIYETSSTGAKLRRYVRLPGSVDEPFLMIDYAVSGACTTAANGASACERWAHLSLCAEEMADIASPHPPYAYSHPNFPSPPFSASLLPREHEGSWPGRIDLLARTCARASRGRRRCAANAVYLIF
jgi:hypothetical protein